MFFCRDLGSQQLHDQVQDDERLSGLLEELDVNRDNRLREKIPLDSKDSSR